MEPAAPAVSAGRRLPENLRFPGCHPLPLPRDQFEDFDLTAEARAEGYAAGYAEGYAAGYAEGYAEELVAAVRGVFQARGLRLADSLLAGSDPFAGASRQAVMAAAVACADEADFRRRLGLPRR